MWLEFSILSSEHIIVGNQRRVAAPQPYSILKSNEHFMMFIRCTVSSPPRNRVRRSETKFATESRGRHRHCAIPEPRGGFFFSNIVSTLSVRFSRELSAAGFNRTQK